MSQKNFDYRSNYFKKHKGILGSGLYLCTYCGKPIKKSNSHVDHITPKSKSNFLFNRSFNTTIACPTCNLKKSDKIDYRIIQGYVVKLLGNTVGGIVGAGLSIVFLIIRMILTLSKELIGKTLGLIKFTIKACMYSIKLIILTTLKTSSKAVGGIIKSIFSLILSNIILMVMILGAVYYLVFRI